MTWQLPEHEHRTFPRNPLDAVVCQLRFDPILKLQPRIQDFQEKIRERFPHYTEAEAEQVEIDFPAGRVQGRRVRIFTFSARQDRCAVVVGDASVALQYRDHRDRSALMDDAKLVFGAFQESFASVSPSRLGLRYVNVVDREAIRRDLGRAAEWSDLVTGGFLGIPAGLADLVATRFATEISSRMDAGMMTLRYGLIPLPARADLVFRLDIDRYREEALDVSLVPGVIAGFSDDIYRVFRAAAGPALLEWMEAKK